MHTTRTVTISSSHRYVSAQAGSTAEDADLHLAADDVVVREIKVPVDTDPSLLLVATMNEKLVCMFFHDALSSHAHRLQSHDIRRLLHTRASGRCEW